MFNALAIVHAVSRRPLTAEDWVQSPASPHTFAVGNWLLGFGTFCVAAFLISPVSFIRPMFHTHLLLHVALTRSTNGQSMGACKQQRFFGNWFILFRRLLSLNLQSLSSVDKRLCS